MGDDERDEIIDQEDERETGAAEEPKSGGLLGSRIVKILLWVAAGLLFVLLSGAISFGVMEWSRSREYEKQQDIIAAPPPDPLQVFELPDVTKTTADMEPHFLKMKISLGYEKDTQLNKELGERKDQIMHILNILLQGKKYDELKSESDMLALGEEIKAHVNQILKEGKVKEVYFKEFTLQ